MPAIPMNEARRVPQRTCLACGRKTAKAELLRLCRDQNGKVLVDEKQRLSGRGAYVCPTPACARLLIKKKALHHGFRAQVSQEDYTFVLEYITQYASPRNS